MKHKALTLLDWRLARKETFEVRKGDMYSQLKDQDLQSGDPYDYVMFLNSNRRSEEAADQFYNQPFTPELIPVLFEGWLKTDAGLGQRIYVAPQGLFISFYRIEYSIGTVSEGETVETKDYMEFASQPKCLADFLSDCQRADLELLWTDETVAKHPFLANPDARHSDNSASTTKDTPQETT